MVAMMDGGSSIDDMALRLAMLRDWAGYGHSQTAFAQRSGFSASEWHNYEKGGRRLSITAALKLRRTWRVTLDWLYEGDRAGLSVEMASSLPHLEDWLQKRRSSSHR